MFPATVIDGRKSRGGVPERAVPFRLRGDRIKAGRWVLEWSDGVDRFALSDGFDLLCDLGNALQLMVGGEVEFVFLSPFPLPIDEAERAAAIRLLRKTRDRMRSRHPSGETVNRYWRMLVMQTGADVEFPYV